MESTNKKRLFVTLAPMVIAELERRADIDNRTISNYLETLLLRHFRSNPIKSEYPTVVNDVWEEDDDLSA